MPHSPRRTFLWLALCVSAVLGLWGAGLHLERRVIRAPEFQCDLTIRPPVRRPAQRMNRRTRAAAPDLEVRAPEAAASGSSVDMAEPLADHTLLLPLLPGSVPDEYVLAFYSEADMARFVALAGEQAGLVVKAVLPHGWAVRVKSEDLFLRSLLGTAPTPIRMERNMRISLPPSPRRPPPAGNGPYAAFGTRALEWLGVQEPVANRGRSVTVAVLDTWVLDHPSLEGATVERLSMLDQPGPSEGEYAGHGTAVTSLIVGQRSPVRGLVPDATILAVEVLDGTGVGDSFTLARGILEAVNRGAHVINLCLGGRTDSFVLRDAVNYARERGVAVVAAVGNDGADTVAYPARYAGVVGVAAVDAGGRPLFFSNRGSGVDLAAPGLGVIAASAGGTFHDFSGTSASTPFVSAALADLIAGGETSLDAAALLSAYARDAGAPGADEAMGAGILDMQRLKLRRVEGLCDVAVNPPYFPDSSEQDGNLRVVLAAQNRGTVAVPGVELVIKHGGTLQTVHFADVPVGGTVSHELRFGLERLRVTGAMTISCRAVLLGGEDAYPADNERIVTIRGGTP
jgi:hypothetical protein